jgi:hypothetical protein
MAAVVRRSAIIGSAEVKQMAATTAHDVEAAVVASKGASPGSIVTAFALVVAGTAVAYGLIHSGLREKPFEVADQAAVYAALAVFAGAVERILEPFSSYLPGTRAREEYARVVAALANQEPGTTVRSVAQAKSRLVRAQANRTVLLWGLATGVAAVVSAAGGFYLLHLIAADNFATQIPTWVDALVTGLVVGTGTKPLHDLITRAQSSPA